MPFQQLTSRRFFQRCSAFAATVVAGTLVTACGGAAPAATAPAGQATTAPAAAQGAQPAASGQPVTLRWFMWSGNPEEQANWQTLADMVHQKYPNITVKLEFDTLPNYAAKLKTQLASDTAPDIIAAQSGDLPSLAVRKVMEPLDPFIKADPSLNVDDYAKTMMDLLTFNGTVYALPYDFGPQILFYNKDLFDKKGVAYPDDTLTRDGFVELAKRLTYEDGGQKYYGIAAAGGFFQLLPWIFSNGGGYMDETGSKSQLDTPEFKDALQFYSDLILKDKVSPPISDPANDRKAVDDFFAGTVAMMYSGPWDFISARNRAKFNWDVALMPKGKSGNVTQTNGSGFGIWTKSTHKQEAYQAISVITSTEGLSVLAKSGRSYPARATSLPAFYDPSRPPANAQVLDKANANARPYKVTPTWSEISPLLGSEIDNVLIGQKSVDQFVSDVNPQFQDLLTKGVKLGQ